MAKRQVVHDMTEDPRYHDTWKLLKRYRDVVWSMELSVQQLKTQFNVEYGSSIDEFLESVYLAGADLSGTKMAKHTTGFCITHIFPHSSCEMWMRSLPSSGRTSATLAFAPTIAGERTQLKHSVPFFGAIPHRIALVFWSIFSLLKSMASNWHRIGSTLARFCY